MTPPIDMIGQRFGRWAVLARAGSRYGRQPTWLCRCDCGTERIVLGASLRSGNSRSCRCLSRELTAVRSKRHGWHGTPTYCSWASMLTRCTNPRHDNFPNYGGREITVCDRWRNHFDAFLADMGPRPRGHTLDRIDPSGSYEPSNCRWASAATQSQNQRPRGSKRRPPRSSKPRAKLTSADIAEIRTSAGATSQLEIARRFGVSQSHVSRIMTARRWRKHGGGR